MHFCFAVPSEFSNNYLCLTESLKKRLLNKVKNLDAKKKENKEKNLSWETTGKNLKNTINLLKFPLRMIKDK